MAEVKRKLRIITEKSTDKSIKNGCVHNFKKGQVVFTEDSLDSGDSIVNAHDSRMRQNIFHSDYEEVEPISGGDVVVSKVLLKSISSDDSIEPNSCIEVIVAISDTLFLINRGDIRSIVHRSEFFALCDRVVQREDSEFAEDENEDEGITRENNSNPVGMGGSIIEIRTDDEASGMIIRVIWDNGQTNSYRSENLEFEEPSEYGEKPADTFPPPVVEEEKKVQKYRPKAGDIVKISNKSRYFKQLDNPTNPKCKGVVDTDSDNQYIVNWDNGTRNYYTSEDLVVLRKS